MTNDTVTGSVWNTRDYPLLEALADAEKERQFVEVEQLVERTGFDTDDVARGLDALLDAKYIRCENVARLGDMVMFSGVSLAERGLRAVGDWPAGQDVESMLALLNAHIEAEDDPKAKSALATMRDGLAGMPVAIGTALLAEWFKQKTGMSG